MRATPLLVNAAAGGGAIAAGTNNVDWNALTSVPNLTKATHIAWIGNGGSFGAAGSVDVYGSMDGAVWFKLGSLVAATPFLVTDGFWAFFSHGLSAPAGVAVLNSAVAIRS